VKDFAKTEKIIQNYGPRGQYSPLGVPEKNYISTHVLRGYDVNYVTENERLKIKKLISTVGQNQMKK
jgi:hypothetical protein